MSNHTRYRLPRARKGRRSRFLWLVVLVGLVVAGWIWWHSGQPRAPTPRPRPIAGTRATQAVVQPKPAPRKPQPQAPSSVVTIPLPRPIAKPSPELPAPGVFPRPVQNVFEA